MRIAGEAARVAAGPLTTAFGVEARREDLVDRPSDIYDSGDVVSFPSSIDPQQSRRAVTALFAEANVPIAEALEAQVSARLDRYSDFGSTTNPKVALRWQPAKALVLRGAWGTGFRAPTLPDLGTPVRAVVGVNPSLQDPMRLPGHLRRRTASSNNDVPDGGQRRAGAGAVEPNGRQASSSSRSPRRR